MTTRAPTSAAARPGETAGPSRPATTGGYAWYALGLLALINLLNYLDRNVIFALFDPIKHDLGLSDAQLGWLGSAYILVFSVAALPFGVLSDLRSRRTVIAGGVAFWSAFTFLGGFVRNFWQLFVCRASVGIGEAAYGPAASSLVADFFPGRGRAMAMGLLNSGIALGGVLGILLGGLIEHHWGWRAAFMVVGLPGFLCAILAAELKDPARPPGEPLHLRDLGLGLRGLARHLWPLALALVIGAVAAWVITVRRGADSRLDAAVFAAATAVGLALTVLRWVRLFRARAAPAPAGAAADGAPLDAIEPAEAAFGEELESAFDELMRAGRTVLRTPTLVFVFAAGALISFGMNGLVGWGPTFISRELGLSAAAASTLLGKWGLIAGTTGTVFGGIFADWLRRRWETGRVVTVAAGFLVGGPLALWCLTIRDLALFVPVFAAAFFFLSWYNGPIGAAIFDVVPARISATVMGAYLLFIHVAGDAIAFPLVGALSDRFGLDRAILLLPAVSILGGVVILGALRTLGRDMARCALRAAAGAESGA
ncbi:MAG TPA: MFS transporter [Gemmatimonadales bacterium]|nr:MFS transporter [Gemmatimonadales bacterium]